MTKTNFVVYKMEYAMELIAMGHKVLGVMPNPKRPEFNCWVFKSDETFSEDFSNLRAENRGRE